MVDKARDLTWLVATLVGICIGYFSFDNSAENRKISYQLSEAAALISKMRDTAAYFPGATMGSYRDPVVTKNDRDLSLAANKRERAGEYILKFERPTDLKAMQRAVLGATAKISSNVQPDYDRILREIGLTSQAAQRLREHREKICLASLEAEMAIQQVLIARDAYDARVRSMLSPEKYMKYRAWEEGRAAHLEFSAMKRFADDRGMSFDGDFQNRIIEAVRTAHAYARLSWHGPYDGLPQVAVGKEAILSQMSRRADDLRNEAKKVETDLADVSLPTSCIAVIRAYYSNEITTSTAQLEAFSLRPRAQP